MLYCSGYTLPIFATYTPERGPYLLVPSVLRPVDSPYRFSAASTFEYQKCHLFILSFFWFYQSCPSSIAPDIKGISPSSGHFFIWTGQQKGKAPPKSGAFENLRTLSADLQRLSDPSPGRIQLLRESSAVHWQGQVLRAHIDGIFESCCLACPRAPMKYVANAIMRV